jgi:hypothetical protein
MSPRPAAWKYPHTEPIVKLAWFVMANVFRPRLVASRDANRASDFSPGCEERGKQNCSEGVRCEGCIRSHSLRVPLSHAIPPTRFLQLDYYDGSSLKLQSQYGHEANSSTKSPVKIESPPQGVWAVIDFLQGHKWLPPWLLAGLAIRRRCSYHRVMIDEMIRPAPSRV